MQIIEVTGLGVRSAVIYLSNLSMALAQHALSQWHIGTDDLGLASADDAEAIARELALTNPDRRLPLLAHVLRRTWRSFQAANQVERALEATAEVVQLERSFAERNPLNIDDLRRALEDQAVMLDQAERPDDASAVRDEASKVSDAWAADDRGQVSLS